MKPGALVIKQSRWHPDSKSIGIVLHASENQPGCWVVLWTIKDSYRIQSHLEHALIELDDTNDDTLLERTCTST